MPDFYYQIKGRSEGGEYALSSWAFPPVFSGLVVAPDKASAKTMVEEEYGRAFPLRVLKKDIEQHAYLLSIKEIDVNDSYTRRRFEVTQCKECPTQFRLIDKYNDHHCDYNGADYCSRGCWNIGRQREIKALNLAHEGKLPPVIYQVRQKSTGKSYVGQTIRPFTLRWWEHLTLPSDSKFHEAIKSTPITDWEFCVLELIDVPPGTDSVAYITLRERHWIDLLNSIDGGFNTVRPMSTQGETLHP